MKINVLKVVMSRYGLMTHKKGKTSRVQEDGTTPFSIATNVVFIRPIPVTHIQKMYELSPRHWHNTKENISYMSV